MLIVFIELLHPTSKWFVVETQRTVGRTTGYRHHEGLFRASELVRFLTILPTCRIIIES